ncbi:hypothetical protein V8E54_002693 [Elaphomyces granulatus]
MEDEWDPNDFGFFYPDMPLSWGTDELIDRDHSTYCRTVHCFNLPSCFLGKAHTWWLEQNPIIQRGLTHCDDVEQWCRLLLGAFELYPDETFAAFDAVRYTVRDALNYRHPKTYVHSLTSAAEQCGILENQWASWAWQHLEQPIRRLIPKLRKGVTSRGFADVLQHNLQREYWETKPSWNENKPRNKTGPKTARSKNPTSQPLQSIGPIQSLQPIQPIQSIPPVQLVQPIQPVAPTQSDAVTSPPSPSLSTATTATGTTTTSIYSTCKVVIRPRSSFRIPIRNPPKDPCNFTPSLPLLSQCGYSWKPEWLRVFNYSNKPIVINRRTRLGSVLKPP